MPEHLRALVVVLGLAFVVFALAKAPVCALAMDRGDFARRRNLWFAVTLAAFLAHNFWIYSIAAVAMLLATVRREPNKIALFFFLLFAVPPLSAKLPGFGLVDHLFSVTHLRLLALTVLVPAFVSLARAPDVERFGRLLPDKILAGYLLLAFALQFANDSFTNTLRHSVLYAATDVFLPYYVASRSLRNQQVFRDALAAFAVAALVLAAIAMVEFLKYWLLYAPLDSVLDVKGWGYGNYQARGANLRAQGSTGQPIVLGYVIAVGFAFYLYLKRLVPKPAVWWAGLLLLVGALVASLSRGPWVGAAAMLLVYVAAGPAPAVNVTRFAVAGVLALPVLLLSPAGQAIIDHLPFVGTVEAHNVTYRQRLLQISLQVILEHPFFGGVDVSRVEAMQELKEDGIIDVVNTFIGVALAYGLVGLSLFVGFFVVIGAGIFSAMRRIPDRTREDHELGRTLLAALVGIMIIIFTVASITQVPVVYWTVAGLGVGYVQMLAPQKTREGARPARYRPARMWR